MPLNICVAANASQLLREALSRKSRMLLSLALFAAQRTSPWRWRCWCMDSLCQCRAVSWNALADLRPSLEDDMPKDAAGTLTLHPVSPFALVWGGKAIMTVSASITSSAAASMAPLMAPCAPWLHRSSSDASSATLRATWKGNTSQLFRCCRSLLPCGKPRLADDPVHYGEWPYLGLAEPLRDEPRELGRNSTLPCIALKSLRKW